MSAFSTCHGNLGIFTPYGNTALIDADGVRVTSRNLPDMIFFFFFEEEEEEYNAVRKKMACQLIYIQNGKTEYGYGFQNYHPVQIDWVRPYLLEEKLGIAILHRCQRLVEHGRQEHLKALCSGSDSPPKYNYDTGTPSTLANELQKLHGEYWKHQESLGLLENTNPVNFPPVKEQMILRKHRDRHGRSYAWVLGQDQCAASGGCCGRSCGCCEKVLNQYLMPPGKDSAQGIKTKVLVLGHCTVECRCCIDFRGCYVPDSRLPSSVL